MLSVCETVFLGLFLLLDISSGDSSLVNFRHCFSQKAALLLPQSSICEAAYSALFCLGLYCCLIDPNEITAVRTLHNTNHPKAICNFSS